ncbi:hypothetical protein [Capnocytophaga sp. oral taxon 323]|jgi:hypothetical protein|uniref:hypothetical protein n=1 Tax=Capnocytophaga sp. oral taxon 323 TaxID=1705617 RepID=UPI0006AF61F3|nr:hypothetical protein [Capnocytophaga sp. oral taxon 323]ALC97842.1 hypothetical protein AM608_09440 [Capnocytophaga sp. oral taxon 323]
MATAKEILKGWFSNFKKPTQNQFWAWIESYWHKDEKMPIDSVEGLKAALENTVSAEMINNHINDTNAHQALFDRKLDKGSYTGTAADLKAAIDAINHILQSDDTDLDQLQEIVNYIKQNKQILSQLGISNIAGLEDALAGKMGKDNIIAGDNITITEENGNKKISANLSSQVETIKEVKVRYPATATFWLEEKDNINNCILVLSSENVTKDATLSFPQSKNITFAIIKTFPQKLTFSGDYIGDNSIEGGVGSTATITVCNGKMYSSINNK